MATALRRAATETTRNKPPVRIAMGLSTASRSGTCVTNHAVPLKCSRSRGRLQERGATASVCVLVLDSSRL
jgi:hypothetical protein